MITTSLDPNTPQDIAQAQKILDLFDDAPATLPADQAQATSSQPGRSPESVATEVTVRDELARLPRRQREAVVLRYYAGMTDAEIADALGVSVGSVKTHLHRAMATLEQRMEALR